MTTAERADLFLEQVNTVLSVQQGGPYAFSGDTARCLWMLAKIPGASLDLWKRICHPWPDHVTTVGEVVDGAVDDLSIIAAECRPAMLNTRIHTALPGFADLVPLVQPSFVLAQLLTEADPLKVTRIADLLRCVRPYEDVDLEEVRSLLKAVRAGEFYETLLQVACIV